jgi:ubiquinone/menaquinone biosynthesis C-methylase UbiE
MNPSDNADTEQAQYKTPDRLNARIEIHKRFSTNHYGWWRWVFDHFNFPPTSRILELGGGPGDLWLENLYRIPPGWNMLLTDFSDGMMSTAAKRLNNQHQFMGFQVVDAQAIPFPKRTCDVVIANHMLYHVHDRQKAMAEINRVLKPGGILLATTVSLDHMKEVFYLCDVFLNGMGKAARIYFNTSGFCLENGADLLKGWFDQVERDVYEDELEVTSTELLTQYILTIKPPGFGPLTEDGITALRTHIQHEIDHKGSLHIQKISGLFQSNKKVELSG